MIRCSAVKKLKNVGLVNGKGDSLIYFVAIFTRKYTQHMDRVLIIMHDLCKKV